MGLTTNMHSTILPKLLDHLVHLSGEHDELELEKLLALTVLDLIPAETTADNDTHAYKASVAIYHNSTQQPYTAAYDTNTAASHTNDQLLQQNLAVCFNTGEYTAYQDHNGTSTYLYPLKSAANQVFSVVAISADIEDAAQQAAIRMLLQIIQNLIWLNNDNERDTLTGLLNRKSFEQKINKVLGHISNTSKRKDDTESHAYFLAIFDIDHFKNVNDTYGHLIGDEVLLLFSQLMTQTFRDKDMLFRFGGEEFIGVFQCMDATDIEVILERFRLKIASYSFPQIGEVTVSIGYTAIAALEISSKLIDRADTALYYAKNHGRNRSCCYEALLAEGSLQESKTDGDVEFF